MVGEGRVRWWGKEGVGWGWMGWDGELMRGEGRWGKGVDEMRG